MSQQSGGVVKHNIFGQLVSAGLVTFIVTLPYLFSLVNNVSGLHGTYLHIILLASFINNLGAYYLALASLDE